MAAPINLPQAGSPFVGEDQVLYPVWYRLLVQFYTRLGGSSGYVQTDVVLSGAMPAIGPAGVMVYVSDRQKPAWSDGVAWRYADGTLV